MPTLLHLSSSPRGDESDSLAIAQSLIDAAREGTEHLVVDHFDLWDGTLPAFGPAAARAKGAVLYGGEVEPQDRAAWDAVLRTVDRFLSADALVFSVPMWNHGVPYILKQFMDVVSQPGATWRLDPAAGYEGLVTHASAAVVYTSAVYGENAGETFGVDDQSTTFERWLRWIGIERIDTVSLRPQGGVGTAPAGLEKAHAQAREVGSRLLNGRVPA